ncbi:TetR/AcrR family transcriptional regulator [Amycolatopsis sp. GM8]|uniref:TetR/AcrR family transcriptional regulator n=1 Tax=Amycolatopsis sp. GM8 TaxID=2896530 RepID=UPI001EFF8B5B|nr:TetR family transcriptional regulator [Amycolatopsis sp. GM8]
MGTRENAVGRDWSGRRADALRNRKRILAVANAMFAEYGLQATITQIAVAAGVPESAIYRDYPAKDDLLVAVSEDQFHKLEDRAIDALAEPDAGAALRKYVPNLFVVLAGNRLLADLLAEPGGAQTVRLLELVNRLADEAKGDDTVRADYTPLDIQIMLCGAVRQLMALDVRGAERWRRYGELVVNALRP